MEAVADVLLRAEAAATREGVGQVVDAVEMTGGHSGLTVAARLVDGPASVPIVIKAAPPGRTGVGRHDVTRQARLLRALGGFKGVHVPVVYFVEEADPPLFGMSRVDGEAIEPILDPMHGLAPEVVRARSWAAADLLAALHAPDPRPLGLEPPRSITEELERWSRTMAAVDPALVQGSDRLGSVLAASVPQEWRPSVVHGDFRLGNLLCAGDQVTAIIDWEIWGVMDPRLDLGWFLVHFDAGNYPGVGVPVEGLPSPAEVLGHYEEMSGRQVDDWSWFDAFGRYKLAAIMGHNLKRHREGRRVDPFQERLPPTIEGLIRTGLERVG